jgi:hypothetical protein
MKKLTFDDLNDYTNLMEEHWHPNLVEGSNSEDDYEQSHQVDASLLKFIKSRRASAAKIANQSARRSGTARLTAKHFKAKDPVYARLEKLVKSGSDLNPLKKEYLSVLSQLRKNVRQPLKFQELTGKLEVLGEFLIEAKIM